METMEAGGGMVGLPAAHLDKWQLEKAGAPSHCVQN